MKVISLTALIRSSLVVLLLLSSSSLYALPDGIYFIYCEAGKPGRFLDVLGNTIFTLSECRYTWAMKMVLASSVRQPGGPFQPQPVAPTQLLYVARNASIVEMERVAHDRIPGAPATLTAPSSPAAVPDPISLDTIQSFKTAAEIAHEPPVLTVQSDGVTMQYKHDTSGGFQVWLKIQNKSIERLVELPQTHARSSEGTLRHMLALFTRDRTRFLRQQFASDCYFGEQRSSQAVTLSKLLKSKR